MEEGSLMWIADDLAIEFCDFHDSVVVRALCDSLRADPTADLAAIHRLSRYRLLALRAEQAR